MRTALQLRQHYPALARGLAVAELAALNLLAGTVLYQVGHDPWAIVAVVVSFLVIANWILERASVVRHLSGVVRMVRGLLKSALVSVVAISAFVIFPIPVATLIGAVVLAVVAYASRRA
jgi:hypothetical protein